MDGVGAEAVDAEQELDRCLELPRQKEDLKNSLKCPKVYINVMLPEKLKNVSFSLAEKSI